MKVARRLAWSYEDVYAYGSGEPLATTMPPTLAGVLAPSTHRACAIRVILTFHDLVVHPTS